MPSTSRLKAVDGKTTARMIVVSTITWQDFLGVNGKLTSIAWTFRKGLGWIEVGMKVKGKNGEWHGSLRQSHVWSPRWHDTLDHSKIYTYTPHLPALCCYWAENKKKKSTCTTMPLRASFSEGETITASPLSVSHSGGQETTRARPITYEVAILSPRGITFTSKFRRLHCYQLKKASWAFALRECRKGFVAIIILTATMFILMRHL